MNFPPITDSERIDMIEKLGVRGASLGIGADGKTWYVTAHSNRECWGKAPTLRECVDQVINGTGPESPDAWVYQWNRNRAPNNEDETFIRYNDRLKDIIERLILSLDPTVEESVREAIAEYERGETVSLDSLV